MSWRVPGGAVLNGESASALSQSNGKSIAKVLLTRARKTLNWMRVRRRSDLGEPSLNSRVAMSSKREICSWTCSAVTEFPR